MYIENNIFTIGSKFSKYPTCIMQFWHPCTFKIMATDSREGISLDAIVYRAHPVVHAIACEAMWRYKMRQSSISGDMLGTTVIIKGIILGVTIE